VLAVVLWKTDSKANVFNSHAFHPGLGSQNLIFIASVLKSMGKAMDYLPLFCMIVQLTAGRPAVPVACALFSFTDVVKPIHMAGWV
jgi:hypothetical protein